MVIKLSKHKALGEILANLLSSRLNQKDQEQDFLKNMQNGMETLAVREAQNNLVKLLKSFG